MKVGDICKRAVIAIDNSMAGIRRVPVVDARGALTGVVAIDDAFE